MVDSATQHIDQVVSGSQQAKTYEQFMECWEQGRFSNLHHVHFIHTFSSRLVNLGSVVEPMRRRLLQMHYQECLARIPTAEITPIVYTLYTLFHTQPLVPKEYIPITPGQLQDVVAQVEQGGLSSDVAAVLYDMIDSCVFHLVVGPWQTPWRWGRVAGTSQSTTKPWAHRDLDKQPRFRLQRAAPQQPKKVLRIVGERASSSLATTDQPPGRKAQRSPQPGSTEALARQPSSAPVFSLLKTLTNQHRGEQAETFQDENSDDEDFVAALEQEMLQGIAAVQETHIAAEQETHIAAEQETHSSASLDNRRNNSRIRKATTLSIASTESLAQQVVEHCGLSMDALKLSAEPTIEETRSLVADFWHLTGMQPEAQTRHSDIPLQVTQFQQQIEDTEHLCETIHGFKVVGDGGGTSGSAASSKKRKRATKLTSRIQDKDLRHQVEETFKLIREVDGVDVVDTKGRSRSQKSTRVK